MELADGIPRGRGGLPKIIPPDGGSHVLYKRPSSWPKALEDPSALFAWYGRQAVKGLVAEPSLYGRAAADPSHRNISEIAKLAHAAAGSMDAAAEGTRLHALTEHADRDPDRDFGGDQQIIDTYLDLMSGFEVVDSELFVVQDELRLAGTLDRLVRYEGRVYVLDLKSGIHALSYGLLAATVQTAVYANSLRYDPATGARVPLHEDMDTTRTIMLHLPQDGSQAGLYWLDAIAGWNAAMLVQRVHAARASAVAGNFFKKDAEDC